jgi:hypothetical protein
MIRIALVIAIAVSSAACTTQSNVPYSSKKTTCTNQASSLQIPGGKIVPINRNVCIPDTPNKACVEYWNRALGQSEVRCMPLTRKSTDPKARARQLAGSQYP